MRRLLVHVEGQTEETFVREVLAGHLQERGYGLVSARLLGNPRHRGRGGIRGWPVARRDIISHLKEDPGCIATTMVDYYGLPQTGAGMWPGRAEASSRGGGNRAELVEAALLADVSRELENTWRFVPFVVMHEFEGLLFSDCGAFCRRIGRAELEEDFSRVRREFPSPEDINDTPAGAPSKRILSIFPKYQKPLYGSLGILAIGLERIRAECRHFDNWLSRLEALGRAPHEPR